MQVSPSVTCREFVDKSTDFLEGALPAELATTLGQHMEVCTDCRRYMTQVEAVIGLASSCCESRRPGPKPSSWLDGDARVLGQPRVSSSSAQLDPQAECLHVDAAVAQAFLEDQLPIEDQLQVVVHLIGGCRACASVCRAVAFPNLGGESEFADLRRSRLADCQRVWLETQLKDEHVPLSPLRNSVDSEGVACIDFLLGCIEIGRQMLGTQPRRAFEIAKLVADLSETEPFEMRARGLMFLGLATRRSNNDFTTATRSLMRALSLLDSGGHPVLRAKCMELLAVNLYHESRDDEALEWARRAALLLLREFETERLGRLLVDTSGAVNDVVGPGAALRQRFQASTLTDFRGAPRYAFAVVQGCALSYSDAERPGRALAALALIDRLPRQDVLAPSDRLRLRWTEGRILSSLERYSEATKVLERARVGFGELGNPVEYARVSLEVALAHLGLGNVPRAVSTIGEVLPLLENARLDQDATAAALALRKALAMGTLPLNAVVSAARTLAGRL